MKKQTESKKRLQSAQTSMVESFDGSMGRNSVFEPSDQNIQVRNDMQCGPQNDQLASTMALGKMAKSINLLDLSDEIAEVEKMLEQPRYRDPVKRRKKKPVGFVQQH